MFKWRSPVEINSQVWRSFPRREHSGNRCILNWRQAPGCVVHDCCAADLCPLGLSVELLSALLALPPLFPPSGRLSAELSSSFLFSFSPFSPTTTRTTTRSLRFGVFSVCQPSYRLLFSLSLPSFLPLVVCLPSYRLLFSLSPLSLRRR